VIPKYVRLFAELKGDVNKTSIMDLTSINPFMGPDLKIENSVDQLDISVGLKGTLAPGLGFKALIFRNSIKDMPLIVSNFGPAGNKFAVVYDNGDSRVNGLDGDLDFKASDDVDVFGRVEFKDYQMAQQLQAWNLPKFKLTAGAIIHINNKVDITGSLLFRGNTEDIPYADALNTSLKVTPTNISSFADLSGRVTYKATNKISIFVKVNNILDSTNLAWVYYPDYGFNIFGGVGFAF
jgi:outer membrane receptor protein involved in Fe transport